MALSAEEAPPSLESEVLFDLDFVCLVGSAQPVRARRFTLKQYLHFSHALVETLEGQQTFPDRALAQLGAKRRVALSLPFFIPAIFAIAQTDLILTVPRKLAQMTAPIARIRVVDPPREIKAFRISWLGIRDSLLNLRIHGFANNGWLPEPEGA